MIRKSPAVLSALILAARLSPWQARQPRVSAAATTTTATIGASSMTQASRGRWGGRGQAKCNWPDRLVGLHTPKRLRRRHIWWRGLSEMRKLLDAAPQPGLESCLRSGEAPVLRTGPAAGFSPIGISEPSMRPMRSPCIHGEKDPGENRPYHAKLLRKCKGEGTPHLP